MLTTISLQRYNKQKDMKGSGMKKIIYHGSQNIIDNPQFGKGARNNDFGRGFYCTENIELAKEWACAKDTDGFANVYQLDMDGLRVLNLNDGKYSILNWLAALTSNRTYWQRKSIAELEKNYLNDNFQVNIEDYDIIIGYRADDSYFSFTQDFVSNLITLKQLGRAMYLGKLGEQIVLKSPEAFDRLEFLEAKPAARETYYIKKAQRDKEARAQYRKIVGEEPNINDLLMIDIVRGEIKDGDSRIL